MWINSIHPVKFYEILQLITIEVINFAHVLFMLITLINKIAQHH